MNDTITCKACDHEPFETWYELACHIIKQRDKAHRRHKLWATKYLHRHVLNKRIIEHRGNGGLTSEDKQAQEDTRRELSGATEQVVTICPRCNHGQRQYVELEHLENRLAWRIRGCLVIVCMNCGGV